MEVNILVSFLMGKSRGRGSLGGITGRFMMENGNTSKILTLIFKLKGWKRPMEWTAGRFLYRGMEKWQTRWSGGPYHT
jgi:hypothetical protein